MKAFSFALRTAKEILRDPLTLAFGIGFPAVLMLLLSAIQANIPVPLFEIGHLTPGIAAFGLSFLSLFSLGPHYSCLGGGYEHISFPDPAQGPPHSLVRGSCILTPEVGL